MTMEVLVFFAHRSHVESRPMFQCGQRKFDLERVSKRKTTLPETKILAPENGWLEDDCFLLG